MRVIRASPPTLWSACSERFLAQATTNAIAHAPTHLWLTHRLQRDRLLEDAVSRGMTGWLRPPYAFFSEFPQRFGIAGKPVGLMIRRRMISTIAAEQAKSFGIATTTDMGVVRGHMLDSLIGELLPEGVDPAALATSLEATASDDFAQRRNAWVHGVYQQYLDALARDGLYDTRSIHALVAHAIDNGGLRDAIGGADALHIYGLYSLRTRGALIRALERQTDVDVSLYLPAEAAELDALSTAERIATTAATTIRVQPAPDPLRELQWVAAEVKSILLTGDTEPHEIAIVARSGREDTRRMCERLDTAGVPYSARIRRTLTEIPALALVLEVFRGNGEDWTYRALRNVVGSSYTRIRIDTRSLDVIATRALPRTLDEWSAAFTRLIQDLEANTDRDLRKSGLWKDRVEKDSANFADLRAALEPLQASRSELEWVKTLRGFLHDDAFSVRRKLSKVHGNHHDVVRFDQRGMTRLTAVLSEWETVASPTAKMSAGEWYRLLRRLLESEELALSTPSQKGVQVLEAQDAAMVPFRHTFVIHVNDAEFPARRATAGVLTEEERAALRAAGLPLEDRSLALSREQALWHAITSHGNVTATYRTTDPRGTPLLPSMLLPAHDKASELPRSLEILTVPVTRDQAHQQAIETLARDARTTSPDHSIIQQSVINAHAEQVRGAPDRRSIALEDRASPWNGALRDPALITLLETRYDSTYTWSASQLQAYARNPFFYLIERVLGLRGFDEADEETAPMTFGGVAHEILERFYKPFADARTVPPADQARTRLAEVTAAVMAERESSGGWLGSKLMWSVTRRSIANVVDEYVAWEIEHMRSSGETPSHVEYVIGGDDNPAIIRGKDIRGKATEMRVQGRVDRIDTSRTGEYLVLDYKSSNIPSASGYQDGALLQAVLYVEALRQAANMNATTGRYRALKKPDKPKNGAMTKVGDMRNYVPALAIAFSIPARVRAGLFECTMCSSSDIANWDPDLSITRTLACLSEGTRFHG